ncbi:MAG: caspase family protein [Pseudomonadales bacterium]
MPSWLAGGKTRNRRRYSISGSLLFAIGVAILPVTTAGNSADRADELLPVDCLLPGAVRKLGGRVNYVTQRRPIKTVAVDCEIRGGEYVAYDRADYGTSMRIWLPLAESGDAKAQNYVGEIYEKGLGVDPNYTLAAQWYLKSAEQNFRAAQINLGQLYETGQGVEQSTAIAAEWYEKASGMSKKLAKEVSFTVEPDTAQPSAKDRQLQLQQQQIQDLVKKLDQSATSQQALLREKQAVAASASALQEQQKTLLQREQELQLERDALRKQLQQSDSKQQVGLELQSQLAALNAQRDELENRERQLVAQQKEQERMAAKLRSERQREEDGRARAAKVQLSLDAREEELRRQREELQRQQNELNQADLDKRSIGSELESKLAALKNKSESLEERERTLAAQQQEQQRILADLKAQQEKGQLEEQRRERVKDAELVLNEKERAISLLRKELDQREQELEQADLKKRAAGSELEMKLAALQKQSDELASQKEKLADQQRQQEELNTRLRAKGNEVQSAEAELAKLKEAISSSRKSLAALSEASIQVASALPVIQLIEPQVLRTRGEEPNVPARDDIDQRTVIGQVQSAAGLMELLINEERVGVDADGFFQKSVPITRSMTPVSIIAIDKKGQRADLSFNFERKALIPEPAAIAKQTREAKKNTKIPKLDYGNYHALVIGNKQYQSLPSLRTSVNDTEAVAAILEQQYGFKVRKLVDATRYDILSALNELRSELNEDDNLLIYYAGHGTLDEVNNRGHWMPVDAEEDSSANWISNIAITDIINAMNARKVLIVSDSCYSGAMTRSSLSRLDAGRSDKTWVAWLKMLTEKRSRLSLSSGGLAPVLDGGGGEHSIFAKAFLDVLKQNETVIEGKQLHGKVAELVSYAASAAQFEQVPQYAPIKFGGHESGDFLFVPTTSL